MASGRIRAIFGVAGVAVLAKIIGLGREMVIAGEFGTSFTYDLYLIAVMIPALAYGVFSFASFYLFVPYITRKFETLGPSEQNTGWRAVWPLFNFTFIASLTVVLALIAVAPYLMRIWGARFSPDDFTLIVFYCRVTSLLVLLGTVEAFFRAILNVKKVFTYPAVGPIISSLVSIVCIMLFAERWSVGAVALGMLTGMLLQTVWLVFRLVAFKPFAGYRKAVLTAEVKAVFATAGVLLIIELLRGSYFLIDRYFAPEFGVGIISALSYAQMLVILPDAVIGFAIASVLFPLFSQSDTGGDPTRFGAVYSRAITGGVLVAVPMAVFLFVNATDIVYLVFFRGVFDAASLEATVTVLKPYTPTVIALFVVSTSARACYGRGWANTVLVFIVILLATKFVATWLLPQWVGYAGISAATSLSQVGFAVLLLILVVRRSGMKGAAGFVRSLGKLLIAGAMILVLLHFVNPRLAQLIPAFTQSAAAARLALSAMVLAVGYLFVVYVMGFGNYLKIIGKSRV